MSFFKDSVIKMDKRVYIVFILVVSVAIANAVLSTIKITNNKNAIFEITQSTNPTLDNLEDFHLLVTRSRMFISNWVYLRDNNNDKASLVHLNNINYPRLKRRLIVLTGKWRSQTNIDQVQQLFHEYESVIHEQEKIINSLVSIDDYDNHIKKELAEEQLEKEIIPATNTIMVKLKELINIKKEEARQMQDAMLLENAHLLVIVFSLAIMVILSVMMAGIYLMKKVILPLLRVRQTLLSMSIGELPEVQRVDGRNALAEINTALFQLREGLQRTSTFAAEIGRGNFNAEFLPLSENDVLGSTLLEMRDKLKKASDDDAVRNWAAEGYAHISSVLHSNTEDIKKLSGEIITGLVTYIEAQQGAIYLLNENHGGEAFIEPVSFYAPGRNQLNMERLKLNEGLIGQAISTNTKIYLQHAGEKGYTIETSLATIPVSELLIVPLVAGGRAFGALEIHSVKPLNKALVTFVERIAEPISANVMNMKANLLTLQLLEESRQKTKELAMQDEELRQINNELMVQSGRLKQSESNLRFQQEALQRVNGELESKALLLEEKNMAVEDAHKALAFKADQLERSNKYKSDFLANMSHELRTPLNSVLILARLLSENRTGNMSEKQVEHSKVIHKSGSDLLIIINDILDLSKIEAGKLDLHKENIPIAEIRNNMELLFTEVSREKNIHFSTVLDDQLPEFIDTDRVRMEQVLKNLLGNAFKVTSVGGEVQLKISKLPGGNSFANAKLKQSEMVISFAVVDNGIGIPLDKQKLIFDAFNQADSSITRKFGGTGLGLAICRQLSSLLGGEITLESSEGKGSVFTLYIAGSDHVHSGNFKTDDSRIKFETHDIGGHVLILSGNENTPPDWESFFTRENFQVSLSNITDFNPVGIHPDIIILDATIPDKEYIDIVMQLKQDKRTSGAMLVCRSVSEYLPPEIKALVQLHTTAPVSSLLVTAIIEMTQERVMMSQGNVTAGDQSEPLDNSRISSRTINQVTDARLNNVKILIADDDIRNIYALTTLFENEGARVVCAMDGFEAIEKFKEHLDIDILIMDIMMPGKDGLQAITEIRAMEGNNPMPIIAVTAKAMRNDREVCMKAGATDYVTKPVNMENLISRICRMLGK